MDMGRLRMPRRDVDGLRFGAIMLRLAAAERRAALLE